VPDKIGKYDIEEKIGVGGFGVVYKGRDPFIKRAVAIKTCQVEDEEIRKRFFREAELAGNLQHPNITTIYDFGVEDGVPYIVLEFLTGEDLDRKIKRGEDLPLKEKVRILTEVCKGLHYAHEGNIIHRDIKPANIRIQEDGSVKIMDFGIAKSLHLESHLTQTGMTLGTAAFLAPEQIRGERLDRRTDIFSLGVLMYNLFTYRKPFSGEVISAIIYSILNKEPEPIRALIPDFPRSLEAVLARCLAKDPAARYATALEVQRALERVQEELGRAPAAHPLAEELRPTRPLVRSAREEEITKKTPTLGLPLGKAPGRRLRWLWAAAAVAVVGIGAVVSFWGVGAPAGRRVEVRNPLKLPETPRPAAPAPAFPAAPTPKAPEPKAPEPADRPAAPAPAPTVPVALFASAPCDIYVDGARVGSFPPEVTLSLKPGAYKVEFRTAAAAAVQGIEVRAGASNRFGHEFPAMGKLAVLTNIGTPYGTVYVDGKRIGDTPQNGIVLTVGTHLVEVKRPGYRPASREIEVREGQIAQYTVTLIPEAAP
jgi:serine/threonine-protein kinase